MMESKAREAEGNHPRNTAVACYFDENRKQSLTLIALANGGSMNRNRCSTLPTGDRERARLADSRHYSNS